MKRAKKNKKPLNFYFVFLQNIDTNPKSQYTEMNQPNIRMHAHTQFNKNRKRRSKTLKNNPNGKKTC